MSERKGEKSAIFAKRLSFAFLSLGIFLIELIIAMFVHDSFIRPYGGDVLITLLLCCIVNSVLADRFKPLPLAVFLFSVLVELCQYFDYAELLGLAKYKVLRVILGSTFSFVDILCYAVGCVLFVIVDNIVNKLIK